jgi:hypothetical protein
MMGVYNCPTTRNDEAIWEEHRGAVCHLLGSLHLVVFSRLDAIPMATSAGITAALGYVVSS